MQTCVLSSRSPSSGEPYFAKSGPLKDGETIPSFWDSSYDVDGEPNGFCPELFPPIPAPVPASQGVLAVHAPHIPSKGWSWKTSASKRKMETLNRNDLVPIPSLTPDRFPLPDILDVLVARISRMEIERPAESEASTSGSNVAETMMDDLITRIG